jgi:hypothetical protein
MQLEFYCPCCDRCFTPAPKPGVVGIFRGLEEQGPWSALGDGETLEDLLYNMLTSSPETACPDCGGVGTVEEGTLGELSHSLLASW